MVGCYLKKRYSHINKVTVNYYVKRILPIVFLSFSFGVSSSDIYDNSWALVIGIDKYENVQKLNYAVDDAESIRDILVNSFQFPPENIIHMMEVSMEKHDLSHYLLV